MTEASAAPVVEEALLDPLTGQELVMDDATEAAPVESATTDDTPEVEPEAPKEDGFQKRINKVTAAKYAAERRAEELERKVQELEKAKPAKAAPKLEDFDFDEDAHRAAIIRAEVDQALNASTQTQREAAQKAEAAANLSSFNERVEALGKDDFSEVAEAIPLLPQGVADALVASEGGAEMIYHLGTNLDVADSIANMTPAAAMMELGRISATMKAQPIVKPSAAPEPIAPLKSGSSLTQDVGADIPITEWMSKFNG